MNRYQPHVYVIPEDDRNRQIADGFVGHNRVNDLRIKVMPPVGGWRKVLDTFCDEYVQMLRNYPMARIVMLIDFDGHVLERQTEFSDAIPEELRERVFVIGSKHDPETLKKAFKCDFESIGRSLAEDCAAGRVENWSHEQLEHNDAELKRLEKDVKAILLSAPN